MAKDKSSSKSDKSSDLDDMRAAFRKHKDRAAGGGGGGKEDWDKLCLAADTYISYHSRGPDGKTRSVKGGSIERFFQVFNGIQSSGRGRYQKAWPDSSFFVSSMNDEGQIFKNQVMGVTYSGKKQTFYVRTAGGFEIEATDSHPFFTGTGYTSLSALKVGDTVFVQDGTQERDVPSREIIGKRAYVYVKAHPVARTKTVDGKYEYKVLTKARAAVEASMNNLSLEAFLLKLNDSDLGGLKFLSKDVVVHHKDENFTNDALSNLQVVTSVEHSRIHGTEHPMRHVAVPDVIEEISDAGEQDTYDITVNGPYHNFVAACFVVHNSDGKNMRRILPRPNEKKFYTEGWTHFNTGPNQRAVRCIDEAHINVERGLPEPNTKCPLCKKFLREQARINSEYKKGDEDGRDEWRKAKDKYVPRHQHYMNVLVADEDDNVEVKILAFGTQIWGQLMNYYLGDDTAIGDFTNTKSGRWMNIKKEKKGGRDRRNIEYKVFPASDSSSIADSWSEIKEMLHDLNGAAGKIFSKDEVIAVMKGVDLNKESTNDDDDDDEDEDEDDDSSSDDGSDEEEEEEDEDADKDEDDRPSKKSKLSMKMAGKKKREDD